MRSGGQRQQRVMAAFSRRLFREVCLTFVSSLPLDVNVLLWCNCHCQLMGSHYIMICTSLAFHFTLKQGWARLTEQTLLHETDCLKQKPYFRASVASVVH